MLASKSRAVLILLLVAQECTQIAFIELHTCGFSEGVGLVGKK